MIYWTNGTLNKNALSPAPALQQSHKKNLVPKLKEIKQVQLLNSRHYLKQVSAQK